MNRMLLGLLSDTHDDLPNASCGFQLLRSLGVERFIHAGDVGGEPILDLFAGNTFDFVWGNNDFDRDCFSSYAAAIGLNCHGDFGTVEVGSRTIAIAHGHLRHLVTTAVSDSRITDVVVGHSHIAGIEKVGHCRVINPGALHRARIKTVATFDTDTGEVQWFDITTGQPASLKV